MHFKQWLILLAKIPVEIRSKLFVAGGFIRDLVLNREPADVDLVCDGPARPLAETLAAFLGAKLVTLDRDRDFIRLVIRRNGKQMELDLESSGPGGLQANLLGRDFTINAMALPLELCLASTFSPGKIIDPAGGLADIQRKLIRVCSSDTLKNDPVRAYRAFRFQAELGFEVETNTLELINGIRGELDACPGERVWSELARTLLCPHSAPVIRLMDRKTSLLEGVMPEIKPLKGMEQGGYHVDDVWEHSLKTLEYFEQVMTGLPPAINGRVVEYIQEKITARFPRLPVLKLCCLLHDAGKQYTRRYAGEGKYTFYNHHIEGETVARSVSQRLRVSAAERAVMVQLVKRHMDPLFLYKSGSPSSRALRRFFIRAGTETPGVLLLSLADISSTRKASGLETEADRYARFIHHMLQVYYEKGDFLISPPKLINGAEICAMLGIKPSPFVGRALEALAEAQVEGKVKNKAEARQFILKWAQKNPG